MPSELDHGPRESFQLYLIKPSHYDDDGYVIQWLRSDIPSNTMAVLNGIASDCAARRILGADVDIVTLPVDEIHTRVRPDRIIRTIANQGGKALIVLVGVQSNQFPRAVDIARPFVEAYIPVCIGGFHVSGSLAMLPEIPTEIREAMDLGISIYTGEAEGHFDEVLQDAYRGQLKPRYNFLADLPGLQGAVLPDMPHSLMQGALTPRGCFDAGRGCPFQCSFCTIINVQGRKSRYRDADDVEALLRSHLARGVRKFFITDDNFARNKNWEPILDRIITLREQEGLRLKFLIQVDTLCHKIPNFIDKAGRAGVDRVFIGLENINPDNLVAAKKKQNRITEYRTMLQAWKKIGAVTSCGYIIGFPNDTHDRIMRDIEIIKRELPLDFIEFFCLTPLPGSEDHKILAAAGVPMDPDMNNYDTEHVTTAHPLMSSEEFLNTYHEAWHAYYTMDHIETMMRRAAACGVNPKTILRLTLFYYGCQAVEGINPLQGGLFRRKYRNQRRYGLPVENPLVFYGKYALHIISWVSRLTFLILRMRLRLRRVEVDTAKLSYTDLSLTPVSNEEQEQLDIIKETNPVAATTSKIRIYPHKEGIGSGIEVLN